MSTHIVARVVRDAAGGAALDALGLAQRELFGPLGMRSPVVEVDATGTMIGAHYVLGERARLSALRPPLSPRRRDARAAHPPRCRGGSRRRPAPRSAPTTAPGSGPTAARRRTRRAAQRAACPRTPSSRPATWGQRVVIVPSERLVVVRLGDSCGPGQDIHGLVRLVREVIEQGRAVAQP